MRAIDTLRAQIGALEQRLNEIESGADAPKDQTPETEPRIACGGSGD